MNKYAQLRSRPRKLCVCLRSLGAYVARGADGARTGPARCGGAGKIAQRFGDAVSTIWISFLGFALYLVVAAGSVTDLQLFAKTRSSFPPLASICRSPDSSFSRPSCC